MHFQVACLVVLALFIKQHAAQGYAQGTFHGQPVSAVRSLRSCHLPKRGIHISAVSLPAWFSFDNWPQIAEIDADPQLTTFSGQDQEDKFAYDHFFFNRAAGTYLEFGAATGKVTQGEFCIRRLKHASSAADTITAQGSYISFTPLTNLQKLCSAQRFSNTHWFHKSLGWRGVLIEANPKSFTELIVNRPADIAVNAAVCANYTTVHFINNGFVGGIWEFMSPAFLKAWHKNTTVSDLPVVPCVPLTPILTKFNVRHIDFMSCDIEGGELEALKTLNFHCITVDVIVVEADGNSPDKDQGVRHLLFSKGYRLYKASKGRDGWRTGERNDWFVHESFVPSARPGLAKL